MKIIVTKVKGKDLKSGDLFTTANQEYWDNRSPLALGEKVYIRTDMPCPENQKEEEIYRVDIIEK